MDSSNSSNQMRENDGLLGMMYSVESVMNFTVEDIKKIQARNFLIENWEELSKELKDTCMSQIRKLVRIWCLEDDPSKPLDLDLLDRRLSDLVPSTLEQINCMRSRCTPPLDGEYESQIVEYGVEEGAYYALIREGGIPSHPFELPEFLENKKKKANELAEFWKYHPIKSMYFEGSFYRQLLAWRRFRNFQQAVREDHTNDWPEYQLKVQDRRRKYRLYGDITLKKDLDLQDRLTTWLEYQGYHHHSMERLGISIDKRREDLMTVLLNMRREAKPHRPYHGYGYAFAPFQDEWKIRDRDALREHFAMALGLYNHGINWRQMGKQVNWTLRLADYRLQIVSRFSSDIIHRESWIWEFESEVKNREENPDPDEDDRRFRYQDGCDRTTARGCMDILKEVDLKWARKALEFARIDFDETIEKEALVNRIKDEVRLAEDEIEQLRVAVQVFSFAPEAQWKELCKLSKFYTYYCAMIDWIEQQRRLIVSESQNFTGDNQNGQFKVNTRPKRMIKIEDEFKRRPQSELIPRGKIEEQENGAPEKSNIENQQTLESQTIKKRPLEGDLTENDISRKKQKRTPELAIAQTDIPNNPLLEETKPASMQNKDVLRKLRRNERKSLTTLLKGITKSKWKKFIHGATSVKKTKLRLRKTLSRRIQWYIPGQRKKEVRWRTK